MAGQVRMEEPLAKVVTRSPEKFMDVSVWFGRRAPFVPQHDDQSKEHPYDGTSLNQSRGQRGCVSAFHPDIGSPLHDEHVIAVERNRLASRH